MESDTSTVKDHLKQNIYNHQPLLQIDIIKSKIDKKELSDKPENYRQIKSFYDELENRDNLLSLPYFSNEALRMYNENCLLLADDALQEIRSLRKRVNIDLLFLAMPAIIGSSIILLYLADYLPSSILNLPIDTSILFSLNSLVTIDNIAYSQGELILYVFVFIAILFIVRSLIAYILAKTIITKFQFLTFSKTTLFRFSFIIMGLPIYSIVTWFFYQYAYLYPTTFFLVVLILDIIRMSFLTLIVPRLKLETIINPMRYTAVGIIVILGILHIALGLTMMRTPLNVLTIQELSYHPVYIVIPSIIPIIVGIIQLLLSLPILRRDSIAWYKVGIAGTSLQLLVWIIIVVGIGIFGSQFVLQQNLRYLSSLLAPMVHIGIIVIAFSILYLIITISILMKSPKIVSERKKRKSIKRSRIRQILIYLVFGGTILSVAILSVSYLSAIESLAHNFGGYLTSSFYAPPSSLPTLKSFYIDHWIDNLAINPKTNMVYVADKSNGSVAFFNASKNKIDGYLSVGYDLNDIVINDNSNKVYVENGTKRISVIDASKNKIVENLTFGNSTLSGVSINPNTNTVYVASIANNTLYVINGTTDRAIANVTLGDYSNNTGTSIYQLSVPSKVLVNPTTNIIYVLHPPSDTLYIINGTTNRAIANVTILVGLRDVSNDLDLPLDPRSTLAISQLTNTIYLMRPDLGIIYVINGTTNRAIVNGTLNDIPISMSIDPLLQKMYVIKESMANSSSLSIIDTKTNQVSSTLHINSTNFIAVNPKTHMVYFSTRSGSMDVMDGVHNPILRKINNFP
jgi:YVTN family beta-propeller protein